MSEQENNVMASTDDVLEVRDQDGRLQQTMHMKDGKPHGEMLVFDVNGKIVQKLNFE